MSKKARQAKKEAKKQERTAKKGSQKKQQAQAKEKQAYAATGDVAFPGQVMEYIGSMGTREGGRQVRVKILNGPDAGRVIRRNVIGPVRIGDILMLRETEVEANPLKGRRH